MICILENWATVPRFSLAEDVSARTLICVVVVPSTGGMVDIGVGGGGVWVGRGIAEAGNVAVTKTGVEVIFSAPNITPQDVRTTKDKTSRKVVEYRTGLLYPRIMWSKIG